MNAITCSMGDEARVNLVRGASEDLKDDLTTTRGERIAKFSRVRR